MDERGHGNRIKTDSINWAESYIPGPIKQSVNRADTAFAADVWAIMDEIGNLLITKQGDYGPGNINNALSLIHI